MRRVTIAAIHGSDIRTGREAAKKRGVRFGRPAKLTADQIALGHRLVDKATSVRDAPALLKRHHE
jgi:hypothetical protein